MKEKVVIGLSGGVDSSVAAALLKKQGYDVIGVTMQVYGEIDPDAEKVADALGIPFTVLDFRNEFRKTVIDDFAAEYVQGHTPNPCLRCNRYVKFGALLSYADQIGAEYIATGHYALIKQLENGRWTVSRAVFDEKDQTYALCRLTQEQLSRTLMPIGMYNKDEIRAIAAGLHLPVASKHDSQDICFIPDGDHGRFLAEYLGQRMPGPGPFVDGAGNVIGTHRGIVNYTVGQRKGLNLAMGHPVFVTDIRARDNAVVIGENADLFTREVHADRMNLMGIAALPDELRASAKIRYAHKGAPCTVRRSGEDSFTVLFDEPQRAVTKGQSLVVYEGDHILMSGIIIH